MAYGGSNASLQTLTELWNGSAWTETTDMATARSAAGSSGTATAALYSGGQNPAGKLTTTEEWTGAGAGQTRTFTDS